MWNRPVRTSRRASIEYQPRPPLFDKCLDRTGALNDGVNVTASQRRARTFDAEVQALHILKGKTCGLEGLGEGRMTHGAREIGNLLAFQVLDRLDRRFRFDDDLCLVRTVPARKADELHIGPGRRKTKRRIVANISEVDPSRTERNGGGGTAIECRELDLDAILREFVLQQLLVAIEDEFQVAWSS
ncbi:hypothetical protein D3C80_1133340 [compost metagenome]